METNYYNRSNNFSAPIKKEPKPYTPKHIHTDEECKKNDLAQNISKEKKSVAHNILKDFKSDDLLLLGIIFLLISESTDDNMLILVLGYLFLSSYLK